MRKLHEAIKVLIVLAMVLSPLTIVQGEEIGGTIGKIKVDTAKSIKIKNGINSSQRYLKFSSSKRPIAK